MLGNWLVLNGAEQYFSRNLNEVSVHLNEYRQHLLIFSLWYISRGPYHFRQFIIFFVSSRISFLSSPTWQLCSESSRQHLILVGMAPKVVTAWRVATGEIYLAFNTCRSYKSVCYLVIVYWLSNVSCRAVPVWEE